MKKVAKAAAIPVGLGVGYLASCLPQNADGALITQYDPVQDDAGSLLNFSLTNNDTGATYESAELAVRDLLTPVTQAVIDKHPDYAGKTIDDVISDLGFAIRSPPTGDVYSGWEATLNGGTLDFGYAGRSHDIWDSPKDLALTVRFDNPSGTNMLDFNQNGIFDPETEGLYLTSTTVPDAFVGTEDELNSWSAPGLAYGVQQPPSIPEPATGLLLGLGCMAGLLKRREKGSVTA